MQCMVRHEKAWYFERAYCRTLLFLVAPRFVASIGWLFTTSLFSITGASVLIVESLDNPAFSVSLISLLARSFRSMLSDAFSLSNCINFNAVAVESDLF